MSFRSTTRFRCDGCKVIESDDVEVTEDQDLMMVAPPPGWLRITKQVRFAEVGHAKWRSSIKHYCKACAPLIESYLAGAEV